MTYLQRDIDKLLISWKQSARRLPLLVRGARQVGKSFSVLEFGQKEFENLVVVNFEQNPEYKTVFRTLDPKEIIENLSLLTKTDIVPGKTLLFLDEIQECPRAITVLRYFYEQMPALHVIGAGSLLEFALSRENFRMPVGRVQYVYMKPFSFLEFLNAIDEKPLSKIISKFSWNNMPTEVVHKRLLFLIKKYAIVGGMPLVITEYIATRNLAACQRLQSAITQTYRDDFGKYAGKAKNRYLDKLFYAIPKMIGQKFMYSHVDQNIQSRELKEGLLLLEKAGIVHRVKRTSGQGVPLEANASECFFKTIFLDIGLMQNICGIDNETFLREEFIQINRGAVAEQFVGQEFLAYQNVYQEASLYYWVREAPNSSAEVDYLIPYIGKAIPVEVKSGKTGRLRSMHLFLEKYQCLMGLRISQQPFNQTPPILSLPFYAIKQIPKLLDEIM